MNSGKSRILELLATVVKRRKLVYINVIVVGIVSLIVSLVLPKWYKAEAIILPPMNESFSLGLGGALGELAGSMLGPSGYELPMLASRADVYETILKSRRVAEEVINRFDLMKVYKSDNIDLALREIQNHLKTEVGRDGSLKVSFEAKKNPQLAADAANHFVATLDRINQETSQSKAKNTRVFIEQRLDEAKADLAQAEMTLKEFQEKNNTLSLPEQTRAAVEGAAQLMGELTALRIQLGVMSQEMSSNHAQVQEVKSRIRQIDKMLLEMKTGSSAGGGGGSSMEALMIPLQKVPELGLQFARHYRELKIQEVIFELLTQQYEQAKIREMEDTPTLQVLQNATPPILKSRPKRIVIILICVFFALVVSLIIILLSDYMDRMRMQRSEDYRTFSWMMDQIKQDFKFSKSRK